jgi:glutamate racemase
MKIAVFDSGIGGITVLKELRAQFPTHDFVYYGDTANVPYGTKSPAQIKKLVISAAKKIKKMNVDAMVIACNTASCVALDECREVMGDVPVYSVVEAGVTTIARQIGNQTDHQHLLPVVVFGTKVTVRSKTYSNFLKGILGNHIEIAEQECPLLVPMIEEGWIDHPVLLQTVTEYVKHYLDRKPGIAFLACTHYPWIKTAFEKALPNWRVIDSAAQVCEMLGKHPMITTSANESQGTITWNFSDPHTKPNIDQLNQ